MESNILYLLLETKLIFCNELHPNGRSGILISRQLQYVGNGDSSDVNSDSVQRKWDDKRMQNLVFPKNLLPPVFST